MSSFCGNYQQPRLSNLLGMDAASLALGSIHIALHSHTNAAAPSRVQPIQIPIDLSQPATLPDSTGFAQHTVAAGPVVPNNAQQLALASVPAESKICRDYLNGSCNWRACRYHHLTAAEAEVYLRSCVAQRSAVTFCQDYLAGRCSRPCCRYYHGTLEEQQTMLQGLEQATRDPSALPVPADFVCRDYIHGRCMREHCHFLHVQPPSTRATAPKLETLPPYSDSHQTANTTTAVALGAPHCHQLCTNVHPAHFPY